MRKVYIYGEKEKRINYVNAMRAAGAQVIVTQNPSDADSCQALLLPGGGDVDPGMYGQHNLHCSGIHRELDNIEIMLVKKFSGRPILGICRGIQLLNVAFGGSLIQDLPYASEHRYNNGDQCHEIFVSKDSFLYKLYGERFNVNSAHHQGVDRLASGFSATAHSQDGCIEAMERDNIFAVQWHPERMTLEHRRPDTVDGLKVFEFFLSRI